MNYQYRFGTSFRLATKTLYEVGGLRRYYQGIVAALVQGMYSLFHSFKHGVSDYMTRTDFSIRGHGSQCGYSGFTAI